jgi:hypothetical protein
VHTVLLLVVVVILMLGIRESTSGNVRVARKSEYE